MIYVTGDLHGDLARFQTSAIKKLKKHDTLLVCGDFGFVWDGSDSEKARLKKLGKRRFKIGFVDGAHENFELLSQYPEEEFCGARARHISGNLWHLLRGEVYSFENTTWFAMGGGVAEDDDLRTQTDANSCLQFPSRAEFDRAAANLERMGGRVDYILTHEPPTRLKGFLQLKSHHNPTEANGLNAFLEELSKVCTFKRWYFGSMHEDKAIASTHVAAFRKVWKVEPAKPAKTKTET